MDQRYLQRQIARVPAFEVARVRQEGQGGATAYTNGRAEPRDGLGVVLGQRVQSGSSALLLAGGDNDAAVALGTIPFLVG